MKLKKCIPVLLSLVLLVALCVQATAAVTPNTSIYSPFWSDSLVTTDAKGMWRGFYIKAADNTLKTDLVNKSGGSWGVPGDLYASIWEGSINVCMPTNDTDVGYLFTAIEAGKVEFTVKGKLESPVATPIEITVTKNNFTTKLFPTDAASLHVEKGVDTSINFVVDLNKDEKVFFRFHSSAEVADTPQFRFSQFQAVYRSVAGGGGVTVPSTAAPGASTTTPTPGTSTTTPTPGASTTTPGTNSQTDGTSLPDTETPANPDDPIIDIDDSFALTPKFEDVKVDGEAMTITLMKKLTVRDFLDSFTIKEGYTITLINKADASEVEGNDTVVTEDMVVRLFNQGTPIGNLALKTDYNGGGNTAGGSDQLPTWAVVLITLGGVILLGGGAFALYMLVIRKKPSSGAVE